MRFSRRHKNHKRGFSLLEVLISIAVLSVAALGVMGSLTFGVTAGQFAGDFSEATQVGREMVENIRVDGLNLNVFNPPAGLVDADLNVRTELTAPPFDQASSSLLSLPQPERFRRNIQITEIDPGRFARIQVRIYYVAKGKERVVETIAYHRA